MSDVFRVLIVDDDEVDRRAVLRAFRAAGVPVEATESPDVSSALSALREEAFDCVFLDFQLPGGDGLHVLREARATGVTTPIVVLTGQREDKIAVELMKAGASDYLIKGDLSPERLEQALRHAVRVHAAEEQARLTEQALRQSEARFRVLHETSPDGFMIFRSVRDESRELVDLAWEYLNPAAERFVGRASTQLVGLRLLETMPGSHVAGLFELCREVVSGGDPRETELHYLDGERDRWVRVTVARLGDGCAASFSDITLRRQAEAERERALAARNRFYAAMSHELRTPINAIIGYTDLLLIGAYGALGETQQQGIERTHRAGQHLLELVNDILDLSKLEAGKMEMEIEPTSLPDLVDDLFATVRPMAEQSGSELHLVDDACTEPVLTDPRRVRQILMNLLSNAIKFGEARPVEVRCRRNGQGAVMVEVRDHGVGIGSDDQTRIFEEFFQIAGGGDRPGTGLGLPISQRLAGLLGGRLEVESVPGEGSLFRLVLPDASAAPAAPADQHGVSTSAG